MRAGLRLLTTTLLFLHAVTSVNAGTTDLVKEGRLDEIIEIHKMVIEAELALTDTPSEHARWLSARRSGFVEATYILKGLEGPGLEHPKHAGLAAVVLGLSHAFEAETIWPLYSAFADEVVSLSKDRLAIAHSVNAVVLFGVRNRVRQIFLRLLERPDHAQIARDIGMFLDERAWFRFGDWQESGERELAALADRAFGLHFETVRYNALDGVERMTYPLSRPLKISLVSPPVMAAPGSAATVDKSERIVIEIETADQDRALEEVDEASPHAALARNAGGEWFWLSATLAGKTLTIAGLETPGMLDASGTDLLEIFPVLRTKSGLEPILTGVRVARAKVLR